MTAATILTAVATGALAALAVITAALSWLATRLAQRDLQRAREELELRLAEYSTPRRHDEAIPLAGSQLPSQTWYVVRVRFLRMTEQIRIPSWAQGGRLASRPARSAWTLANAASFLLPAADRDRYSKEFRSELWDLAQSGGGRLHQLRYALRQLRSALPMRIALRSPRRRSAAP